MCFNASIKTVIKEISQFDRHEYIEELSRCEG